MTVTHLPRIPCSIEPRQWDLDSATPSGIRGAQRDCRTRCLEFFDCRARMLEEQAGGLPVKSQVRAGVAFDDKGEQVTEDRLDAYMEKPHRHTGKPSRRGQPKRRQRVPKRQSASSAA